MSQDESLLHDVIDRCKRANFTGVVFVRSDEGLGQISFVSGVLDDSRIGTVTGDAALAKLRAMKGVTLDVHVRLPESKGLPFALEGGLSEHAPVEIFHYCEQHALTCVVELRSGGIKGMANYVLGELTDVSCGGDTRDLAVTNMIAWKDGTYRIVLPDVVLPPGVTYQAPKRFDDEAPRKDAEAKKADEARKAEEERKQADARKAEEARRAEDARRADEAKRKAEDERRAAEARRQAEEAARAEAERKAAEAAKAAAEAAAKAEAAKQAAIAEAAAKAAKAAKVEEEEKAAREAAAEEARARAEGQMAVATKPAGKVEAAPSEAKPAAEAPKSEALSAPPAPRKKSALPTIVFVILAIAAAAAAYMKFMR
jgi:hypothetical protein